jgi:hypothetical protein
MQQAGDHIVHVVSSAARISGRPYLKVKQFVQEASQKKKKLMSQRLLILVLLGYAKASHIKGRDAKLVPASL